MELVDPPPSRWLVTLIDGSVIEVWAGMVSGLHDPEDAEHVTFQVLMDIEPELQDDFDVTARTPGKPTRVIVAVARFPRSIVLHARTT